MTLIDLQLCFKVISAIFHNKYSLLFGLW